MLTRLAHSFVLLNKRQRRARASPERERKLMMRFVNAPQHLVQSVIVVCRPLGTLKSGRYRLAAFGGNHP
ncbi:hypothetical protein CKO_04187 [Citrobacter koseri ATCC BAA-895]|uniref:Uncharacterized protein n=1 Tax=Citrobacter koseri (strain ATCC BAA-895 / CDC 4225-83 / SGSC4696) TaxID=290338 RepID=A8AP35_CITK8|nr:hypothetical protein CKO_04187 [Citrobacter koseri ATCC BAA-895]